MNNETTCTRVHAITFPFSAVIEDTTGGMVMMVTGVIVGVISIQSQNAGNFHDIMERKG